MSGTVESKKPVWTPHLTPVTIIQVQWLNLWRGLLFPDCECNKAGLLSAPRLMMIPPDMHPCPNLPCLCHLFLTQDYGSQMYAPEEVFCKDKGELLHAGMKHAQGRIQSSLWHEQ